MDGGIEEGGREGELINAIHNFQRSTIGNRMQQNG